MKGAIGIDIGGTNVKIGLVLEDGHIVNQRNLKVTLYEDAEQFLFQVSALINEFKIGAPEVNLVGIGIGSPGANSQKGVIEKASNLPWRVVPVVPFLKSAFDLPVVLTNDSNLFAIGEKVFGQAREMNDFVVVTLGTGVGAGIFANGKLLNGKDGLAGEVGHTTYQRNGRPCKCGKQGCLEQYASASGFMHTVKQLLTENKLQTTLKAENLTAEQVAEKANQDDPLAKHAFDLTGQILGEALADLAACLDPEAIFISGGLTKAGDLILQPTQRNFKKNLLSIYPREIPLMKGSIADDQVGILGAAALIWNSILKTEESIVSEI